MGLGQHTRGDKRVVFTDGQVTTWRAAAGEGVLRRVTAA